MDLSGRYQADLGRRNRHPNRTGLGEKQCLKLEKNIKFTEVEQ